MKICLDDECPVHTFLERESLTGCPGCDRSGTIVPCPECLGTGLRAVPGRDRTLVCTGCEYEVDLDEEAPAFLGWVEKMTEQTNLEKWGQPKATHHNPGGWGTAPSGSIQWHLDSAREQILHARPHDLEDFDAETDLFVALFLQSLGDVPVDSDAVIREGGETAHADD